MKMSHNSGGETNAILQTVESSDSGFVGRQLHTYMHSGNTRDSGFWALTEVLMPAASLSHDPNSNSCLLQPSVKRKPDTASKTKSSSSFKQPQRSVGEYSTGISVLSFEEVNNDDDSSQGNDDNINLMILGRVLLSPLTLAQSQSQSAKPTNINGAITLPGSAKPGMHSSLRTHRPYLMLDRIVPSFWWQS